MADHEPKQDGEAAAHDLEALLDDETRSRNSDRGQDGSDAAGSPTEIGEQASHGSLHYGTPPVEDRVPSFESTAFSPPAAGSEAPSSPAPLKGGRVGSQADAGSTSSEDVLSRPASVSSDADDAGVRAGMVGEVDVDLADAPLASDGSLNTASTALNITVEHHPEASAQASTPVGPDIVPLAASQPATPITDTDENTATDSVEETAESESIEASHLSDTATSAEEAPSAQAMTESIADTVADAPSLTVANADGTESTVGTIDVAVAADAGQSLTGTDGDDTLTGGSGDDIIDGGKGDDLLTGGNDDDTILGGMGDDTIDGGAGNDTIDGGKGKDSITGGDGADSLSGGNDNDTIDGGSGQDTLYGGDGKDSLHGGAGDDTLDGGAGADSIFGGDGSDALIFASGAESDYFSGGEAGGWTDVIQVQGEAAPPGGDWTVDLTEGSVLETGADYLVLSEDTAGTVTLSDGSDLTFEGVERIEW
ncbi:MAG: hypothetical protein QF893_22045 [Alphaproteobacteria bacterium]|jgi:hypothetical protein|nr:hypothetical protein [Alphaproteobacteria bacterium]